MGNPHDRLDFGDDAPQTVSVLIPLAVPKAYDYGVPTGLDVPVGAYVTVPLGPREVRGVVWGPGAGDVAPEKLKAVLDVLPLPPMTDAMRKFIDWIAAYTLSPKGTVLRLAMAVPSRWAPRKPSHLYEVSGVAPPKMTAARERVLAVLGAGPPMALSDLTAEAGASAGVVKGLVDAGSLHKIEVADAWRGKAPDPDLPGADLTDDQAAAAASLKRRVAAGDYSTTLIEGVTGSGKTEVYFEAMAEALKQDPDAQVLILVPEIALTTQFLDRFKARFGTRPLEWHSDIKMRDRARAFEAIAEGRGQVVVGARSALFLPFQNLKLIIVDEEHDPAFKQEDHATYHARDMAVVRGHQGNFPVILASATPSLESEANVQAGRYQKVALPARFGDAVLPDAHLIDLKETPPESGKFLSPPLVEAVQASLEKGEQALLFLNRRGYAPLTLCRTCGHRFECPDCSAWLVEHRFRGRLQCHHCGHERPKPKQCPECGTEDNLVPIGPGVERIAEEVASLFPEARTAILSSDQMTIDEEAESANGSWRERSQGLIHDFADGRYDLLIGTQIIAKGHHFPNLTTVGVVDADIGLSGGDPRAAERSFSLITQVAGRAGRADKPGAVYIQTHEPHHPVMQAIKASDRTAFAGAELRMRKMAGLPPHGRLAALILSGRDKGLVMDFGRALAQSAPRSDKVMILGPAPAPLALIRGRHRMRFLVKTDRDVAIQQVIADWLNQFKLPSSLRLSIDIDPQSFL